MNTYEKCAQEHVLHGIHIYIYIYIYMYMYIYIYYISADPIRFESVGYPFHEHINIPSK